MYIRRRLEEMFSENKRDFHMAFINLEIAYNRIPREVI